MYMKRYKVGDIPWSLLSVAPNHTKSNLLLANTKAWQTPLFLEQQLQEILAEQTVVNRDSVS